MTQRHENAEERGEQLNTEKQRNGELEDTSNAVLSPQSSVLFILYGVIVLIWLSAEDNAMLPVTLLGWTGAALLVVRRGGHFLHGSAKRRVIVAAALGLAIGAGAALATAGLMLLKTGMHSHINPDYLPEQFIGILSRAPVWALAGSLAGLGASFLRRALTSR